ncbi:nascent polypeptide-associated complex subunit alpha, muscle-specific form-like [Sciurus carolinensis]|uniref:nascent polypeptide-associated complex subunit alpha, muscle-specific form-like n=1 Tax=Sciurus carolinensis TaxID=30640 RepID=UPI001FB35196|nr:nascent polypeptide-associated complex subunit alpha, muscle-specific form-like [Sciurus carolinensis]
MGLSPKQTTLRDKMQYKKEGMSSPQDSELSAPQSSPYPASPPPGDSAGLGVGRWKAKAVCKQASSASLRDVHSGPGKKPHSAPPGANPKGAGAAASLLFTHRAAPEPRPGRVFLTARGLVAPHGPRPPEVRGEEGLRPQSRRVEAAAVAGRLAPHSPRLRPPSLHHGLGESSLSRKSPPREGTGAATGAAAKPRTPEGAVVAAAAAAAAAAEAQCPPSRIGSRAAAATRVPVNTAEPGGGHRLRWDDQGAAGGDPPQSLQRRGGRSSRPRRWATAPPGPQVPLRRRYCGCGCRCRAEHERQGTRRSAASGWLGPRAPCAALRPLLTTLPGSRKPAVPTNPWRSPPLSDPSTLSFPTEDDSRGLFGS